jgi:transposase
MNKKYIVELTIEERKRLEELIDTGKAAKYKIRYAQMLLLAEQGEHGVGWPDEQIAKAYRAHRTTVEHLRKRFVEQGLEGALERQKRHNYARKLDGEGEARLIALACSQAPQGRGRWTLRLLADKLVELNVVDEISYGTVRRTLKKTSSSLG